MRQEAEGRLVGGTTWRWATVGNRTRIVAKDIVDKGEKRRNAAPSIAKRQAGLVEFYERFEKLVETICDAAQHGPNPHLEEAYRRERAWAAEAYPHLRQLLDAFLPPGEPDAFDRLLVADDLSRFLAEDDGAVIFRINATRQALSLYAEHLRQLAFRNAA